MESRIRIFLLIIGLISFSTVIHAADGPAPGAGVTTEIMTNDQNDTMQQQDQVINPDIMRRQVKEAQIDTENFEVGIFYGLFSIEDFGTQSIIGARLSYHITEDFFFEGTYAQSKAGKTSAEKLYTPQVLTDDGRKYNFYTLTLGYNLLPGESYIGKNNAFNSAVYFIGGIGNTQFGGDKHFTIVYGAGYRLIFTDWLAIHGSVRDHVFKSAYSGEDKNSHNIEMSLGVTYFF